jgi:hypothetical protein
MSQRMRLLSAAAITVFVLVLVGALLVRVGAQPAALSQETGSDAVPAPPASPPLVFTVLRAAAIRVRDARHAAAL